MALFDIKTQTTAGRNYLTQAVAGSKIIWDGIKVSTDYFSNPVGLADLTKIVITSPVDYAEQVSDGQFDIGGHVDSSKVHSDTIIKTWGLYGHVGTDNSQLLAVLSSQSGQTLYANTRDVQTIKETFSLVFPNPSNTPISFVVSNSGFALDDNVVHTTGDETASGVKNFQDGVKSGGKNVVTQNGDDTINVTNGLTNNAIEPVDKSKIKDSIIQVSLSSSNNIDNLENDGRYPFDSVTIAKIDPNNKISGYLDQSTNGSTIIQGTVYTVGTTKYVKYRSKSNGVWSEWNTSASVADMEVKLANKVIDNKNGSIQVNGKTITPADNSKVVHTTGDETIDGKKKFDTDPTDGAGNAYAKTIDVNQQLDKKVNIADMRKPASDVAGIEEVNAKQDKIGYTPADDSKVVHNSAIDPSTMVKRTLTADDDILALDPGTYYVWSGISPKNYPKSATPWGIVVVKMLSNSTNTKLVEVFDTYNNHLVNIYQGYPVTWSGWRVPNSDTIATKSDVSAATANKADDSKVAHLSGANNFDTVPTVNNNPLLLASSLPSDLARTGSNQEFTGKNTFDTAPIDKTTGNPYITKDGVPSLSSDLARTGQANTFSSLQTFSQGVKTLQTGSYDDANSLVNEGLYYNTNSSIKNGARSLTTGYIQVMSGYGEIVRQIMYSDTDGGLIYDRTSQDGGSSWSNWTQIVTWSQLPSNMVLNNRDTNFTAKLQQNGQDVALANNTIFRSPNTGSVSSANTFTAAQTFSIAPTITDASQDKGDTQAATMADLKSVENSAWRPLIQNFDTNYFQNEKYYNFNAFIKVSGGKAQIVGYLQDRSGSSYPFGTYIRLANLPSGISFQNDINNLGVNVQGIVSSSYEDKIYSAAVDGTINAHSSDNSIGIIFQKDSNFNTNVDWFQPGTYGAMESYPTWTINGMTYDIKLSD